MEVFAVIGLIIIGLIYRDYKNKRGFWYSDRYKPDTIEPSTRVFLSDEIAERWVLVLDNESYQVYWDGCKDGDLHFYQKPELTLEEIVEGECSSLEEASSYATDWHDNHFGYPCVVLDTPEVTAIWEGKTEIVFQFKETSERFVWKDPTGEMPSTKEDAEYIAEIEWSEMKENS